ncbi:MAG: magnesium transporter [Candidatus Omnitrophica bacterium]|nr:magnesium transporter [Candidatus Omnitrophota bacterium]
MPAGKMANHNSIQPMALLLPEMKDLLIQRDLDLLKQLLKECQPADLVFCWSQLAPDEQLTVFQLLSATQAVKLFENLEMEAQRFLLGKLDEQQIAPLFAGLHPHDLARLLHRLPHRAMSKMKNLVKREEALQRLQIIESYPPNSVGALMHTTFVRLTPRMTAHQALQTLQAVTRPHEREYLYALFVTDEQGRLIGGLALPDLVSAAADATLGELMTSVDAIKVRPTTDQEEAAKIVARHDLNALPVVNDQDHLTGILTVDDIIDIIRAEASEDIAKMAGTKAEEFLAGSAWRVARLRMPWLVATIIGGFIVSLVIKHFEGTLQQIVALASFLPLIAAMGGNVGAQSATIAVRGLAIGQIHPESWRRVMLLELRVGLLLGISYGIVVGVAAHLLYAQMGWVFAAVVGLAMLTSMAVASTIGSVEPFVFLHFRIDPATATGPLITTITDLISTSTYLALGTLLLVRMG